MLPMSNSPPPHTNFQSPSKLKITPTLSLGRKISSFTQLRNYFSSQFHNIHTSTKWLLFFILFFQVLLFFFLRYGHFVNHSFPRKSPIVINHSFPVTVPPAPISKAQLQTICPYGTVYVYDLPPVLNSDLIRNCHELNPWHSFCDKLSNDGFGKIAVGGISKYIPENLKHAWHWTDQFALEVIYHNRMMKYPCRSLEPESATAFYIPFYAGLAVGKYLWYNYTNEDRDRHCEIMLDWVTKQSHWRRSNGSDHFLSMGRISWDFRRNEVNTWGSSCIFMPGMQNITRLLIERHPWDPFDVGVPYPTGFHPSSAADMTGWQDFVRRRRRKHLYCFAGGKRRRFKDDFRGLLLSQCYNNSDVCQAVDCSGNKCSNGTSRILETFLDSDFCLQPRGDSLTRRSAFDCMVAGSIPVFFWWRTAYLQYAWFLPEKPESYSVFIHRRAVQNGTTSIRSVLENISKEKVKKMREKVIEYIPKLVYSKPNEGFEGIRDAFDVAVEGVLKRIKEREFTS
ncbi:OLC1v1027277C1 [Oldenlandia corymbosa var. corymbosa]|uniref:OLC1v1027277C1 n=1 Tax=Oldenlandia corymbosa var. corymbosa TaxID=529605 RepID=A0AAV1CC39_OLDCO|nr:OLC1v1027277C1 [Oldenlandia corymbosa var. corymbosa]